MKYILFPNKPEDLTLKSANLQKKGYTGPILISLIKTQQNSAFQLAYLQKKP